LRIRGGDETQRRKRCFMAIQWQSLRAYRMVRFRFLSLCNCSLPARAPGSLPFPTLHPGWH
jgi:hypothetical protein